MAEEKKAKDVKEAQSKPKVTIADTVRELGVVGAKDRTELAQKVVTYLNKRGVTKNIKGKVITVEHVTAQIGAIIRCIAEERGKDKKPTPGWWSTYRVDETDTWLKILPKTTQPQK